jgi:hypothetical protein
VEFDGTSKKWLEFTSWSYSAGEGTLVYSPSQLIFGVGVSEVKFYNKAPVPINTLVPGVNSISSTVLDSAGSKIVFPFNAINIPASATSVTFDLSFDLTDIIQSYNSSSERFKSKWWESVYMTVSVE